MDSASITIVVLTSLLLLTSLVSTTSLYQELLDDDIEEINFFTNTNVIFLDKPSSPPPTSRRPRSRRPTNRPSKHPKIRPTKKPLQSPSAGPPTFRRGELSVDISSLGIRLSTGLAVRVLARANHKVKLANGTFSSIPFHSLPDGAAVFPLPNGYVYVSNSEMKESKGGVYAVYFDYNGNVVDYKMLLSGTTRNCSGGKTPWNTWISCEEYGKGQCWQVDPDPDGVHHAHPQMTVLGQNGGVFESVACDNSDPSAHVFFVTEDAEYGALRRYRANGSGWDALHQEGVGIFDYLEFLENNRFHWTTDLDAAKQSQAKHFRNVEGIDYFDGK